MTNPIIQLTDISASYDEKTVLSHVNLTVYEHSEGHIKAADNLSERFNTVDTTLRTLSSSISELKTQFDSKEKDLYNTINALKGEVTSSKRLLTFCFIAIIISLLLNFIAFIK